MIDNIFLELCRFQILIYIDDSYFFSQIIKLT